MKPAMNKKTFGGDEMKKLVSHRFELSSLIKAYETFTHAAQEETLKVVIRNGNN
jgi:threonine dehydrogenase-like Zn-dependent dehydrogenase